MENLNHLLAEHRFFQGLGQEHVAFLAGCGKNVRFRQGEYLFHEGDAAECFLIVREGLVALEVQAPGRGALVVDTAGADDIVGVSWLFPPYRYQFDGRAVEPTRAVCLDGVCIREKCESDPRLGYELMKRLSAVVMRRMHSARLRLLDLYGDARAG